MASPFERITRPFATPVTIARQQIIPVPVSAGDAEQHFTWGQSGTVPDPVSTFIGFTVSDPKKLVETARATETRRITNPDDHTQHVDVKTPTKIKLQEVPTSFAPSAGAASNTNPSLDNSQFNSGKNSQGQVSPTIWQWNFETPKDGSVISTDPGPPGTTF